MFLYLRVLGYVGFQGFMSRIALIECDWTNAESGEELPERLVLKASLDHSFRSYLT